MPGIVFEVLDVTHVTGESYGSLFVDGDAAAAGILGSHGAIYVTGQAWGDQYLLAEPEIPPVANGAIYYTGGGVGYISIVGEAASSLFVDGYGFGGAPAPAGTTPGWGEGAIAYRGYGLELVPDTAYGFLVEQPPIINSSYGAYFSTLEDDIIVTDWSFGDFIAVLTDTVQFDDRFLLLAKLTSTIEDSLVLSDFVTYVAQAQINDTFAIDDLSEPQLRIIGLIADQLVLADDQIPWMAAVHTIVAAMLFADEFKGGRDATLADDLVFLSEFESRLGLIGTMVSDVAIADEFEFNAVVFGLIPSDFAINDDQLSNLSVLAEILDSFELGVRFTVGGDTYAGYSVNTKNAAVSEYDNWPFNSLALVGGKLYGAGPDGLYLVEGDDDAGVPITARLRLGVTNFGTMLEKRVPNAYIGYTSDGSLVLKTITMDNGFKKENWYRMKQRPEGAPAESRFDIAKGLRGVYWAFELVNEDGADFTLDVLQLYPIVTNNRRYSGR